MTRIVMMRTVVVISAMTRTAIVKSATMRTILQESQAGMKSTSSEPFKGVHTQQIYPSQAFR